MRSTVTCQCTYVACRYHFIHDCSLISLLFFSCPPAANTSLQLWNAFSPSCLGFFLPRFLLFFFFFFFRWTVCPSIVCFDCIRGPVWKQNPSVMTVQDSWHFYTCGWSMGRLLAENSTVLSEKADRLMKRERERKAVSPGQEIRIRGRLVWDLNVLRDGEN